MVSTRVDGSVKICGTGTGEAPYQGVHQPAVLGGDLIGTRRTNQIVFCGATDTQSRRIAKSNVRIHRDVDPCQHLCG